jgi:soluble lytic murein transglycosylase
LKKIALLLCFAALPAWASVEADLAAARAGSPTALSAAQASARGSVLESYPQYWQLARNLDAVSAAEVQGFLSRNPDSALAERLRLEWLKKLAKYGFWTEFATEYAKLAPAARDEDVQCSDTLRRFKQGEGEALTEARGRWATGRATPAGCTALFDALANSGKLSEAEVWRRVRLQLTAGNLNTARAVSQFTSSPLSAGQLSAPNLSDTASKAGQEAALFAIQKQAKAELGTAAAQLANVAGRLDAHDVGYGWGQLALVAAKKQDMVSALVWFDKADPAQLSAEQWDWWGRAALRQGRWDTVLRVTEAMPEASKNNQNWLYWRGRALKARGKGGEANPLFARISQFNGFYGLLAREELGTSIGESPARFVVAERDVVAMGQTPSVQRALALFGISTRLGLPEFREDARREWRFAMRGASDEKLLAAAEVARQAGFYDMAIYSADRTERLHDFSLRYLSPYRDITHRYANQLDVDEAWIYGLIRQESRFVHIARSGVGASGLMQLMPATAKWVAGKIGLGSFSVNEIGTNIQLGTWYLRHVFDRLDGNAVMATAAYNAGPGRARAWQANEPLEGAIYAETIPFTETRDYVQKVMANAVHYAANFSSGYQPRLKERMGTIPAR